MTVRHIIIAATLVILTASTSFGATNAPSAGDDVSSVSIVEPETSAEAELARCETQLRHVHALAASLHRLANRSVAGMEKVFIACGWRKAKEQSFDLEEPER